MNMLVTSILSLILNKENVIDTSAHVLDLSIIIIGGQFLCRSV